MQTRQGVAENAVNAATAAGKADLSDLVAAFRKVAEAISEDVELDAVLHIVGRECCALLDVHRCSVYLKDEEADVYRGRVGEPDPAWDESIKRLTCGTDADRFTQEIVAQRRPVLITDAQHDPRPIRSAMRAWDVHSMLGVPMVERGVVTGLIFLDNGDVPHTFSDHQQEVAATFANLAGIAISQARRSAELRTNLATVARQNGLLRRSATIDERLTALVLDAAGCPTSRLRSRSSPASRARSTTPSSPGLRLARRTRALLPRGCSTHRAAICQRWLKRFGPWIPSGRR